MDALKGLLGTGGGGGDEPPASVLAEWNKYSQQAHGQGGSVASDIEAGAGQLLRGASDLGNNVGAQASSLFSNSFKSLSTTVSGVGQSVNNVGNTFMPSRQQMLTFGVLMAAAVFFLTLAFTVALPVLVIAPSKFAFSFTLGSGCFMAAFGALRGFKAQVEHMTQGDRLPFTVAYLGSMVATLYAALFMHSYIFCLIFSAVQLVALVYYTFSYLPGGTAGAKFLVTMTTNAVTSCFGAAARSMAR